jgi:hypothetical protein
MNQKIVFAGSFLLLTLLSGYWLNRTGRPLNVIILTLHKLISLGSVICLTVIVYRIHQSSPLIPVELGISILTLLFFVALIATGGLLSTAKTMPAVVLTIHQIMPFLVILSTSATLYLVLFRKQ